MEKWTDEVIKQQIEDVIAESYLLSLNDMEINGYFSDFVESCETVLHKNAGLTGDIRLSKIKIALLRSHVVLKKNSSKADVSPHTKAENSPRKNTFSRQVIHIKNSILHIFKSIDPDLSDDVLNELRKLQMTSTDRSQNHKVNGRFVSEALYLSIFAITMIVLYVVVNY